MKYDELQGRTHGLAVGLYVSGQIMWDEIVFMMKRPGKVFYFSMKNRMVSFHPRTYAFIWSNLRSGGLWTDTFWYLLIYNKDWEIVFRVKFTPIVLRFIGGPPLRSHSIG